MNRMTGNWEYYDETFASDPITSFAFDDMLQVVVGEDDVPKVRAWVHHPYVILGLHDMRVPELRAGLDVIRSAGYQYILRNSGGLGVVLDSGVLSMTLVMPRAFANDIDSGYEMMYGIVARMFPNIEVEAKEIRESYCPGTYDLSIGGRKFAGISQRRIRGGVAVQIYLSVEADHGRRARVMRAFYDQAVGARATKFSYPSVDAEKMGSLSELTNESLTLDLVRDRFLAVMEELGAVMTPVNELSSEKLVELETQITRMQERNKDLS